MGYKLKRILIYPDGVTEKQVYPAGWKPNANTIAYYPLTSTTTVNDQSGNNRNLTNSNVTFGTYQGVSCARISGNSDDHHTVSKYLYGNISGLPTGANPRTYNLWLYQDNAASARDATYFFQGTASTNGMVLLAQGRDASGNVFISQYGSVSSSWAATIGQWHNLCVTYDGTKFDAYKNGTLVTSWTYAINTGSNKFSLGGASESTAWSSFNGAFSNMILENRVWSSSEVSNYYNQTKGNYGL